MKTTTIILLLAFLTQISHAQVRVVDFPNTPHMNASRLIIENKKRVLELRLKDLSKEHDCLDFSLWTDRQLLDFSMNTDSTVHLNVYYFYLFSPLKRKTEMKYVGTNVLKSYIRPQNSFESGTHVLTVSKKNGLHTKKAIVSHAELWHEAR